MRDEGGWWGNNFICNDPGGRRCERAGGQCVFGSGELEKGGRDSIWVGMEWDGMG